MLTKLEIRRRKIGLTQSELARRVGIDPSVISRGENGCACRLKTKHKKALSKVLGIPAEELFNELTLSDPIQSTNSRFSDVRK